MLALISALLFYCSSIIFLVEGRDVFVTPHKSCGLSCSGDITKPYDNLLIALQNVSNQNNITIYLLSSNTESHYVLQNEFIDSSTSSFKYQITPQITIPINDVLIKPLFCDEEPTLSNPSLASTCTPKGHRITVYLKTTQFSINILNRLQIQNIVFDAAEDMLLYNSMSSEVSDCLYNRKICCMNGIPSSGLSISYDGTGDYSGTYYPSNFSLFNLENPDILNYTASSFYLENTDFLNFLSPNLTSLIMTGHNVFSLQIRNSTIDRIYFYQGMIYHSVKVEPCESINSTVYLANLTFTNYNPTSLTRSSTSDSEGYLFMINDYFIGSFSVLNSRFINVSSSVGIYCAPLLTNDVFTRPMTNAPLNFDGYGSLYSRSD